MVKLKFDRSAYSMLWAKFESYIAGGLYSLHFNSGRYCCGFMAAGKIGEASASCGRTGELVGEGGVAFWVFCWNSFVGYGGGCLVNGGVSG